MDHAHPRRIGPAAALGAVGAILGGLLLLSIGPVPKRAKAQAPATPPLARPAPPEDPYPLPPEMRGIDLANQTREMALAKSASCMACHPGSHDPHFKETVRLGCTDCHGGNAQAGDKAEAHVHPKYPEAWGTTANPIRSYTLLNHETPEFVRFVNPGDFRVAHISCGTTNCHPNEVMQNKKSMMTHGAMLWGAALYNNGSFPRKSAQFGESYSMNGTPQRVQTVPPPTEWEKTQKGVVEFLDPLPRFEAGQPGNVLRIFERGRLGQGEIGLPNPFADPGKPKAGLSERGLGTKNRTDPVFVSLTKTRLFDPTLNFLGTNDHPGDYRSSGCTACHVVYANDRSPVHSGPYAKFGNLGLSQNPDPTVPKNERGHPIEHRFTSGIPTSQCLVCHIHPGTLVLNEYVGYTWWDQETDGNLMYPKEQKYLTSEQFTQSQLSNPDETAARGNWSDPRFLEKVAELNPQARHTQFADFHGHGWVFRAVFKKDRKGNLLDSEGRNLGQPPTDALMAAIHKPVEVREQYRERKDGLKNPPPNRDGVPVHSMDIHMEKGMHCVDCHFVQDVHGNNRLQREVRAAIEITCVDCHGAADQKATLLTSGPASYTSGPQGRNLKALRTPSGKRRFEMRDGKLYQNSMVEPDLSWEIVQTADTLDPKSDHYNQKSAMAKTVRFGADGNFQWGDLPSGCEKDTAHSNTKMNCISCHSAWNPSCFGCHLPQRANKKMPSLHNEGNVSRNYTSYNFQTLRDEVFMLAKDADVVGNKVNPARSSCAIHVGSYNANRESIYVQQQTISAEGMSGVAFSTNVPHTVRGGPSILKSGPDKGRPVNPENYASGVNETKQCTDCHVSAREDNNAIMAQLLMQGTNYVNFIGKYAWVAAGEHGFHGVVVTEQDEPQAVIGSYLQSLAFPDNYREHLGRGAKLEHAHEHPGRDIGENLKKRFKEPEVLTVQNRGEFLYAACGENGVRIFDIAFIDHKGFSERITTAPVSPLGQKLYVRTKYATSVVAPTTAAPDPTRTHRAENKEQSVHPMYAYIYATDREEGLITIGVGTLLDGNPLNNFVDREVTFNPGGILCGARSITLVGTYAYITCDAGLVVVSLDDPKKPRVTSIVGHEFLKGARAFQAQFRYGFACDEEGVKVLDLSDLAHPRPVTSLPMAEAHNIYLARTYAYVAAGREGLVILDIENPTQPRVDQVFNAGGCIDDLHDVKLGITFTSEFAYLADGKNGMRVVQLTSPETPGNMGFSPRPTPRLIATYEIPKGGHALSIAKGLDRDRAVDESGNQISVFGRVGARPFNLEEQHRMYLRGGQVWKVTDDPRDYPPPMPFVAPAAKK